MKSCKILCIGQPSQRLQSALLPLLLAGWEMLPELAENLSNQKILFALSLDEWGMNPDYHPVLRFLRSRPGCVSGCVGGLVVDGAGDLYTKSLARELVLAANGAGCAFPGRCLVESIGSLANFAVQARNQGCDLETAYIRAVSDLAERVENFSPRKSEKPNLLVLHASSYQTSNTLALWDSVKSRLGEGFGIREIGLRNGTMEDCGGCPYTACLHFGEKGGCFYGGVMVQEVYPALREADGLVMLCPNYNDAVSANLTAAINRLTALYRTMSFSQKALFGLVVSGYSGGDIVASQLVSSLCMNKGFYLPPEFCMMETANDPGAALRLEGIEGRVDGFAKRMKKCFWV
jgi:multimeric flavodoxin WrbA